MAYKKQCRKQHRRVTVLFIVLTCFMVFFAGSGVYGLMTVAPQAKKNQHAVEEMLITNQQKAEQKKEAAAKVIAQTSDEETSISENQVIDASQLRVTAIGDSVMLAALNEFYAQFPNGLFDAVYGRTIYDGIHVLMDYEANGQLGDVMLFALGTNSYINEEDVEALIVHSDGRPVFLLNTFGVSNDSTAKMEAVAARYPDVFMVDWNQLANANRQWFTYDGLHPDPEGCAALAGLVYETMTNDLTQLAKEQDRV